MMNTNRAGRLLLLFLVVGVLLANSVSALTPLADPGDLLFKIITLDSPKVREIVGIQTHLGGLLRFLLVVGIFALLYAAAERAVGLGKNISIILSLIIAIVAGLLVPFGIVEAAALQYGAIVSSILLIGIPAAILFAAFYFIERHWLRFIVILLLLFIVDATQSTLAEGLQNLSPGTSIPLSLQFQSVLASIYSIFYVIIVLLGLWTLFGVFGETSSIARSDSKPAEFLRGAAATLAKVTGRYVKKTKTATLRQYMEDESELKLLDKIRDSLENTRHLIMGVVTSGKIEKEHWNQAVKPHIEAINDELEDAYRQMKQKVGRRTYHQWRLTNKLIKELEKQGIDKARVSELEAEEKTVIEQHEIVKNILEGIMNHVDKMPIINKWMNLFGKELTGPLKDVEITYPIPGRKVTWEQGLREIYSTLKDVEQETAAAIEAEEEAIKMLKGFIAQVEALL